MAVTFALEKLPRPPAPQKRRQAAGRVGGRDKCLERRTCGQGALAPRGAGGWGFSSSATLAAGARRHRRGNPIYKRAGCHGGSYKPRWHLRSPHGRIRRVLSGTSPAAKARWRPMSQLRRHSRPPAPQKASQNAGRAGGRDKPAGAAPAARVRWPVRVELITYGTICFELPASLEGVAQGAKRPK